MAASVELPATGLSPDSMGLANGSGSALTSAVKGFGASAMQAIADGTEGWTPEAARIGPAGA